METKKCIMQIDEAFRAVVDSISPREWQSNKRLKRKTIDIKKLLSKVVSTKAYRLSSGDQKQSYDQETTH